MEIYRTIKILVPKFKCKAVNSIFPGVVQHTGTVAKAKVKINYFGGGQDKKIADGHDAN